MGHDGFSKPGLIVFALSDAVPVGRFRRGGRGFLAIAGNGIVDVHSVADSMDCFL